MTRSIAVGGEVGAVGEDDDRRFRVLGSASRPQRSEAPMPRCHSSQ